MEAIGAFEPADDARDAQSYIGARQEAALAAGQHGHDAEAGAARRHGVAVVVARHGIAALARHSADRVAEVPEITQRLALHAVQQGVVGERCHWSQERQTMRFVPRRSDDAPMPMTNSPGSKTGSGAARVSARMKARSAVVMRNETVRLSPGASAIF